MRNRMEAARKRTVEAHPGPLTVFKPGDLVWVRTITHRLLKRVPGCVEAVTSSVSYDVSVQGRVRHVSSSHLRRRSPAARYIDEEP